MENESGLRENFKMQKNYPLSVGKFTDAGYRYKKNVFSMNDEIMFGTEKEMEFFSFEEYNEDTFDLAPGVTENFHKIADIYLRISTD